MLADRVELLEHGFLDADFLEHGLDDEVHLLQIGVVQRGAEQRHALLVLVLLELALLDLRFVVLADGGQAPVQRLLLHLQHLHRDAGVEEVHGDAAAHGASADHADALDFALGRVRWHVGNLARGALGQEQMAQRTRFGRPHQVDEQLTLHRHAVGELALGRGLDRVHALGGRGVVLGHALDHVARELKVGIALGVLARQVAHQGQRARAGDGAGIGQGFLRQRFGRRDHLVEQLLAGQGAEHVALDGLAADDHVECHLDTHHARQALRAAGARQQAQLHFRQGHVAAGRGNPVMATEGQLQAAAHAH